MIPPRGGWHFIIQGNRVEKHSESEVAAELKKWRLNNGTFTSDDEIDAELWRYYCAQEPERCRGISGRILPRSSSVSAPLTPREITPELQGPPMWGFLNTIAVVWTPALHEYFIRVVDGFAAVLDCPKCREHWRSTLAGNRPNDITTRFEACQWTNRVHNLVNGNAGNPYYPYERMVLEWGAPAA